MIRKAGITVSPKRQSLSPRRHPAHDLLHLLDRDGLWYITNHFVVNMGNDPVVAEIVNGMTEDVAADRLRTVGNDTLLVTVPQRISMAGAYIEKVINRQRLRRIVDRDETFLPEGI